MEDVFESLKIVNKSNKYIVSDKEPKFIGPSPWVDVYFMIFFAGKTVLSKEVKSKLDMLEPLFFPTTTHYFKCSITNDTVFIGLKYYKIGNWVINSASLHYIVKYDIFLPDNLFNAIESL